MHKYDSWASAILDCENCGLRLIFLKRYSEAGKKAARHFWCRAFYFKIDSLCVIKVLFFLQKIFPGYADDTN